MKKFILLTFLFSFQASAYQFLVYTEYALSCTPYNDGFTVAKNLDILFLEKNENNKKTIEYVAINHHNSYDDNGGHIDPLLGSYYGISTYQNVHENWEFSYEIEYFTNTITILDGDDNGFKLFTHYISDGPVEYGFYSCEGKVEEFKKNELLKASDRMGKAMEWNVASKYKVEITSDRECGSYDETFLGYACRVQAEVLNLNEWGEDHGDVILYFDRSESDQLRKGKIINTKAISIADRKLPFAKKSFYATLK